MNIQADGERLFITQGDANPSPDVDPVREVQIRGTVWYAIPYVGWAALALQGEQRAIVITIAVIALFAYGVGVGVISRRRHTRAPHGGGQPLRRRFIESIHAP